MVQLSINGSRMIRLKKSMVGFLVSLASVMLVLSLSYTVPVIGNNTGSQIVARAASPTDAFNKLQNSKGGVLGSEVNDKVTKLGADVQSLVLSVVMAVLTVTTLWTSTKFSTAGDNPSGKAKLKDALIWQVCGIGFLASYSGLLLFGLQNLNLFGK